MLYFNVRRVLEMRGIERPYAFLVKNGFTSQMATNLSNNRVGHVSPQQLEKLCVLLHCTPNDLFEWQADERTLAARENHPLNALSREKSAAPISEMVKDLPVEKMQELEAIISEMKNAK